MLKLHRRVLPDEEIRAIERRVAEVAHSGNKEGAWNALAPLLRVQRHQRGAARSLVDMVRRRYLDIEQALEVLGQVFDAYGRDDAALLAEIGIALEGARDIDDLNAPPPDHQLYRNILARLSEQATICAEQALEARILDGLSTAARLFARQYDEIAEQSYRRLIELDPENSAYRYGLGLFFKTRGRFREGMLANQQAIDLMDKPSEACEWNLGICATGAREAGIALDAWKRMDQKIELGRFGLPEGGYPQCKVRLAERPLAERTAQLDEPGIEETIWIERLSPCHGIVRSVLYQDLGLDYGDVVLIDGAPITYHTYGETQIAVFPHLATLVRNQYQFYDFAGTQDKEGRLTECSEDLARDAVVYSHTENFQVLCQRCWRSSDLDHEEHVPMEKHIVRGRIAAPPEMTPFDLLSELDRAVAGREACRIYSPDLCDAAGLAERAEVERRRFGMLVGK